MHSLIVSAIHPTSSADHMLMMSGKIISFITNLARRTETTTLLVNVKNSSLYPIVGIIDCRTVHVLPQTMIFRRLRSTLVGSSLALDPRSFVLECAVFLEDRDLS